MKRAVALLLAASTGVALAHPAPSSIVRLEFGADQVRAEYWVPVCELGYARAADPAGDFDAYLLRHVAAESRTGTRWRVRIAAVREARYQDQPYLVARLELAPPRGEDSRDFVLLDDAVTHEVRNHVVYVVTTNGADSGLVGALQYPARRLEIVAR